MRRLTRKARKLYEQDIIKEIQQNPKFWQNAQAKLKTRTGIPNLIQNKEDTDDLTKSDLGKEEVLADYFSSVFTRKPDGDISDERTRCFNTVETYTIDPLMVAMKLKIYKSPGPDGLHTRVLNYSIIFKTSLTTRLPRLAKCKKYLQYTRRKTNKLRTTDQSV